MDSNLIEMLTKLKTSERHFPRGGSVFSVRGWKIRWIAMQIEASRWLLD